MDRRVINTRYSLRPMELTSFLCRFLLPNRIDLICSLPRLMDDKMTIEVHWEHCPHDSGTSTWVRLSEDGNSVLIFDPEMDFPHFYEVTNWAEVEDSEATASLPWTDDPADMWMIFLNFFAGFDYSEHREEREANVALVQHTLSQL